MFDLFAAIQEVDPTAIPLMAILASSAAMYVIGILLPCSACCEIPPCLNCTEGELPDTVTVTLDGFTDQTPGPFLCSLDFSACFGGGAAGRVTTPGGDPVLDKGPITGVELTNAGSGYAKLGRLAPTLTLSGGSGTGATLTPTLGTDDDACGIPFWHIASVAVSGGTGYLDGDAVTITAGAGDTTEIVAAATIHTTRSVPSLTPSISPGTGATFTISYTPDGPPATWYIIEIEVTDGGTGYVDNDSLTLSLGSGDHEGYAADAIVWTNRLEPTLAASVVSPTGSGASLAVTLAMTTDWDSRDLWEVSGLSITSGGIDYEVGDPIQITPTDGQEWWGSYFSAEVSAVDGSGAITAVSLSYGGGYFKDGGVIESVQVSHGGSYWHDDGVPTSVTVEEPGRYYLEDPDEDPYVADVTVTIDQTLPSDGAGAVLAATVEDDTASPDFGKITAVAITDAGDDYLAWEWRNTKCCGDYYNGMSIVLRRLASNPCRFEHAMCGVGNMQINPGLVRAEYLGPSTPMTVSVFSEVSSEGSSGSTICNTTFTADENVADCSALDLTLTAPSGATAILVAGGEYDATFRNPGGRGCFICCKGENDFPEEVEFDISSPDPTAPYQGVYVRPYLLLYSTHFLTRWQNSYFGSQLSIGADLRLCSDQYSYGFFPGDCGDNCHKKCRVDVFFFPTGIFPPYYYLVHPDGCGCQDTPICDPYGEYLLCDEWNPGDCPYTATISAPL